MLHRLCNCCARRDRRAQAAAVAVIEGDVDWIVVNDDDDDAADDDDDGSGPQMPIPEPMSKPARQRARANVKTSVQAPVPVPVLVPVPVPVPPSPEVEEVVFIAPKGKSFHVRKGCSGAMLSISRGDALKLQRAACLHCACSQGSHAAQSFTTRRRRTTAHAAHMTCRTMVQRQKETDYGACSTS